MKEKIVIIRSGIKMNDYVSMRIIKGGVKVLEISICSYLKVF